MYSTPPQEPVKAKPVGANDEELADSKERNRILYESALKKWDRRIYNLETNLLKVRSMIWDKYTSKTMKDKLEPLSNFSTKLSRDPVALLLAIKVQMRMTLWGPNILSGPVSLQWKSFYLFGNRT